MEDLKNITPVGEKLKLDYERDYNGNIESLEITVYPLTAGEKIEIQKHSDILNKLVKIGEKRTPEEDEELVNLNNMINNKYAYFTMKKNIPDITEEFIKEKFPSKWFKAIFYAVLKAEGIDTKDIEKEKN